MIQKHYKVFKTIEEISFSALYSKYKYGCMNSTKLLAQLFAKYIYSIIPDTKEVLIVGGSCDNLDNPMYTLSKEIVIELGYLMEHKIHLSKIHRIIRHNEPYCQMIFEDRQNLIAKDVLHFDLSMTKNKTVVILDDVFITGAHERKVLEIIKPDYYLYLLKYEGKEASIEEELNLNLIKDITDILNLYINHNLIWQSRNVKYVLNNQSELNSSINIVNSFIQEAKRLALLNGYQHIGNLKHLI